MIKQFLRLESSSGVLLMIATILAILCNNSALSTWYDNFLTVQLSFSLGTFVLAKPLLLWINDGLMAIFFLLVGLELKREFLEGQLQGLSKVALPLIAAIGGIIVPAAFYVAINWHDKSGLNGWAIPTATDIAFALGILTLLGSRIPVGLKLFLMALAIIDDIGAILIIAVFHTSNLSYGSLAIAAVLIALLVFLNRFGVRNIAAYVMLGILLWICVLKSGVHATLAGVVLGFVIPLERTDDGCEPPLVELEHSLHPWVAFLIMPIFAFANAGLSFKGITFATFAQPVVAGIIAGLFIGKQLGVFLTTWGAIKLGIAKLPENCSWLEIYGVSLLCGVGFTMSLFIGSLAFHNLDHFHVQVRLGVLLASVLSGISGYFVVKIGANRRTALTNL